MPSPTDQILALPASGLITSLQDASLPAQIFAGFVILVLLKGIFRAIIPRKPIELPPEVTQAVLRHVPEIQLGDGSLDEIDVRDHSFRNIFFTRENEIPFEQMPVDMSAVFQRFIGSDWDAFTPYKVLRSEWENQPVWRLKGTSAGWKWEVVATAAGRLVELEAEAL